MRGGRQRGKKILVGVAVEVHEPRGFGRCRMRVLADASAASLHPFVADHVEPGATLITDGVPWLIAALLALLALVTMTHAMATMVSRHRKDLAVLAVFGLGRAARGRTTSWAGAYLLLAGAAIGILGGLLGGRLLWRYVAGSVDLAPDPAIPLAALLAIVVVAIVACQLAAYIPASRAVRQPPAQLLRAE